MDGAFRAPTIGLKAMLRQLSYEAMTVAVAAIRLRVERQQEGQITSDYRPRSEMRGFESSLPRSLDLRFKVIMSRYMQLSTSSQRYWRNVHLDAYLCLNASAESRNYNLSASTSALCCLGNQQL